MVYSMFILCQNLVSGLNFTLKSKKPKNPKTLQTVSEKPMFFQPWLARAQFPLVGANVRLPLA